MKNIAYIALGTNIEPREHYLESALKRLEDKAVMLVKKKSSVYETVPVGYKDQPDFLNMVIELETSLSSMELLHVLQNIELELGRERKVRFGPRTVDLDILIYNKERSKIEKLILPHPRMHKRAFVLIPLQEIAADLIVPGWNESVDALLKQLQDSEVKGVKKWKADEEE